MKSLILSILALLLPLPLAVAQYVPVGFNAGIPPGPSTPTFVTGRSSELTSSAMGTQPNTGCPSYTYCAYFPSGTLARNLLTVFVEYSSTPTATLTITTDKSQTFTAGPVTTAESSKLGAAFYLCGATANTREIQIASGTAAITIDHVFLGQYAGIKTSGCLDTSSSNQAATNTTFTSASLTPSVTGDLLVNDGCAAGTVARTSFTAGSQTNITWAKRGDDIVDGCMEQWGVYSSTSAINPQFTTSPTSTFLATTMAFKAQALGTAPSGMYVIYAASENLLPTETTFAVEIPSTGNLQVLQYQIGTAGVASVSDGTNTWINTPGGDYGDSPAVVPGQTSQAVIGTWYVPSAVANTNGAITITQTQAAEGSAFVFLDIAGAASKPVVSRDVNGGYQATAGALTYLTNYIPGTTSGLTISSFAQANDTSTGTVTPASALFLLSQYGGQSLNGPSTPDQNDYMSINQNTSNAGQNYEPTQSSSTIDIASWAGGAVTFLNAGGSYTGPSIAQMVGNTSSANANTITVTLPFGSAAGDAFVIAAGNVNGTTVSGVSATGCSTFAQATSAASSTTSSLAEDIWYCFTPTTGDTTVTVTFSGAASGYDKEATLWEVRNISTFDIAGHSNNATGSGNLDTGPSITTTGSAGFVAAVVAVDNEIQATPAGGNAFGYGGVIYSTTDDATSSLITNSAGAVQPVWLDGNATGGFCASVAAFK